MRDHHQYGYQLYGLRITSNQPRPEARHHCVDNWHVADIAITFHPGQPLPTTYAQLPWRIIHDDTTNDTSFQILLAETPSGLHHSICIRQADKFLRAVIAPTGQPGYQVSDAYAIHLYWDDAGDPTTELQTAITWAFDIALGHTVRLCVPANLHGSALALNGQAVAFLGRKGAGKSTLTVAMVRAGWPMLADDHVALWPRPDSRGNEKFWVEPGAPRLRLWPSSLPVISKQAEELPRLYAFQEKRLLALHAGENGQPAEFQATALPLAAIYLLEGRDPTCSQPAFVRLEAKEALYELLLKRFSTAAISTAHATAELSVLAQIAQQVPVTRLYRPDGLHTLPQLIASIQRDLTALVRA